MHGPGGHGALAPISSDIVAFFTRWLKDDPAKRPFVAVAPRPPEDLQVTLTGQLSTSIGGETIQSLNLARYRATAAPRPVVASAAQAAALRAKLKADIRAVTQASAEPGATPPKVEPRDGGPCASPTRTARASTLC